MWTRKENPWLAAGSCSVRSQWHRPKTASVQSCFFLFLPNLKNFSEAFFGCRARKEQERWIYLSLPWRHKDAGARKKYLLRVRTEWGFFFQGRKGSSREVTIKYLNDEIKAVNIIKKAVNMSEWYSSYKPVGRWKPAQIFLFFYFFCTGAE